MEIDIQSFTEYSLNILVGVVTAAIGLSYPFFQQIIQQIDTKYGSILIVRKFQTESVFKWYKRTIISSVILLFYMPFAPKCLWQTDCIIFTHSAQLLALMSCAISIIFLIKLSRLIYEYNDPQRLLARIISKKYKDGSFIFNADVFNQFNDILKYSIKTGNVDLYIQCNTLYGMAGNKYVEVFHPEKDDSKEIVYPSYFYMSINDITQLCFNQNQFHPSVSHPEHYVVQLFQNTRQLSVSDRSLSIIWYNVTRIIDSKNFSWLLNYWAMADGQFQSRFCYVVSGNQKHDELCRIKLLHHLILAYTLVSDENEFFKIMNYSGANYSVHSLYPNSLQGIVAHLCWLDNKLKLNPLFLSNCYTIPNFYLGLNTDGYLYGLLLQFYSYLVVHSSSLNFIFSDDWSICRKEIDVLTKISTLKPSLQFSNLLSADKLSDVQQSISKIIEEGKDKKIQLLKESAVKEDTKNTFSANVIECISNRIQKFPCSKADIESFNHHYANVSQHFQLRKDTLSYPKDSLDSYISYHFSLMELDMEHLLYCSLNQEQFLATYSVYDYLVHDLLEKLKPNKNFSIISFGLSDLSNDFSNAVYLPTTHGIPMSIYIFRNEDMPNFLVKDIQHNITTEVLQTNNAEIADINISYKSCLLVPKGFKCVKLNVVNQIYIGIKTESSEIKPLVDLFADKDSGKTAK